MHKLGDTVTTEEEEEKFRHIKEKIRSILTARRNLYNAGVELLECDRVYAEGIKAELERHIFVSHTVPFVGAGAIKKPIDEADVRFYLEMRLHIYVKEEVFIAWIQSFAVSTDVYSVYDRHSKFTGLSAFSLPDVPDFLTADRSIPLQRTLRPQCLPIVLSRRRSFSASPSRYSICPRFPQRIVT